jgi:hypothetical protein
LYAEQEAERKKWLDERAAVLKDARSKSAAEVFGGKERVARRVLAARRDMEAGISQLAAEIAARVIEVSRAREVR